MLYNCIWTRFSNSLILQIQEEVEFQKLVLFKITLRHLTVWVYYIDEECVFDPYFSFSRQYTSVSLQLYYSKKIK